MASLQKRKRKKKISYLIQFVVNDERKTLFLGERYSKSFAEEILEAVENIVDAASVGEQPDRSTRRFLETMPDDLFERFERAGLVCSKKAPKTVTIEELFRRYLASKRNSLKPTSIYKKEHCLDLLCEYFPGDTAPEDIQKADVADMLDAWLGDVKATTLAHRMKQINSVFNWGVEYELIRRNPFKGVKTVSLVNKTLEYYIPWSDYEKMLDACETQEERALLAIYRVGGVRFSEAFDLTCGDVDFEKERLTVHASKTERYGRGVRVIPLFPDLRRELEPLFDDAPDYSRRLIQTIKKRSAFKQIGRIIERAGLTPWPRRFQNFRVSRSNDVYRQFGAICESEWIGHDQKTAKAHYLHITDEDYERALLPQVAEYSGI